MPLKCIREPDNQFDRNAILIMAPPLEDLAEEILDVIVQPKINRTAREVAGKKIGRMPRVMAKIISPLMSSNRITKATAIFIGGFRSRPSVLGDGAKMNCLYFFEVDTLQTKLTLDEALLKLSSKATNMKINVEVDE